MSKSTFFTGQPVFNQILNFIPRDTINKIVSDHESDKYYKSFKTYDHLVTMLYAVFNQCTTLREVTTGLLAWEQRIQHLGIKMPPRRSTISDANMNRSDKIFEDIYLSLLNKYKCILPDSRKRTKKNNLYIFDSTSIALFKEILKGAGASRYDGKRKGGIKVHTLLHSNSDVPTMIRYSASADSDIKYLSEVKLPKGSVVVFDKGYRTYRNYNRLTDEGVTWVTRHIESSVFNIIERREVNDYQKKQGVKSDWLIELGHSHNKSAVKVEARIIKYYDKDKNRFFSFITNNKELAPFTICGYYQQRWQIETFFKRIKQNYPLDYFLGDNENAIKIQIWCTLIADLLLKVIKKGSRSTMAYSNVTGLVRLHLMTYMDLISFLCAPEKTLIAKFKERRKQIYLPSLFPT